ncbi:MAG TPA: hypothetical protein VNX28_04035 [Gemmataceae bacterium]|nr:hypothetical protein [Gemmataceae bacterium]
MAKSKSGKGKSSNGKSSKGKSTKRKTTKRKTTRGKSTKGKSIKSKSIKRKGIKPRSSQVKRVQNTPPPTINVGICTDIADALMGQQVNFTSVPGPCTISKGNTTWPFNWGPDIHIPNPANPVILIAHGLNTSPGQNVYEYVVSCCTPQQATKTVTVTG